MNADSPSLIRLSTQPLSRGGRSDSGSPDDGLTRDAFTGDDNAFLVDFLDGMAQANFDAELLQALLRRN